MDNTNVNTWISEFVDHIQPQLSPYETAIYWHMFRNSIIATNRPYLRASVKDVSKGIGTKYKDYSKLNIASDKTTGSNIRKLIEKNLLILAGDTNRQGTLYKIVEPKSSTLFPIRPELEIKPSIQDKELDYYNVKELRMQVFERDGYLCYKCDNQLTKLNATLDHIQPVSAGGSNSIENLITCCFHCNSKRRASPISDFIASGS